jgi:RNA polymerase sigma-70 factor, ECF subfamily
MNEVVNPDPVSLLDQARRGDSAALGRLLESYRSYMTVLTQMQISRRLQSKVDAADVVQEAFLSATRYFGQFRGDSEAEFLAWLRQVLASVLANLVRHYQGTKRRDVRLERRLIVELGQSSQALDRGLAASQSSPSHQAARREQSLILADALARLPPEWRDLLILRHLEGLTFPEVALRMGRTVDTVKKQWPKALAQLRILLGEETL